MGSRKRDAKLVSDVSTANSIALHSLKSVLHDGQSGFYFLIASPRKQAEVIRQFDGENLAIHDFSKENRKLTAISDLLDSEPDRRAYVFLNFHLALWNDKGWDHDAVRRLNFSRNGLAARGKTLIFCLTQEADDEVSRHALDFYDFIKLFFRFQDEPEARPQTAPAPVVDMSTGIEAPTVDFSLPEEELLALAIALGNQADELMEKGQYNDALELYEKQREIREHVLGTEDLDMARTYSNIGTVYQAQGDYSHALGRYFKALRILHNVLGTEHPEIATMCNNIGSVFSTRGDYAHALEWYYKALRIRQNILGNYHPDTAISYNNIGAVYQAQGNYGRALNKYNKALRIQEEALGIDHPDMAQTYNNIGGVYASQGDYAQALEWYYKALQIVSKPALSNHPNTATSYNNISLAYKSQGDYAKALKWYFKALRKKEKLLDTDHPDLATSYHNIGTVYFEQGDYKTALEWLNRALKIREKVLGAEHPDTKDTRAWIRAAQRRLGESPPKP